MGRLGRRMLGIAALVIALATAGALAVRWTEDDAGAGGSDTYFGLNVRLDSTGSDDALLRETIAEVGEPDVVRVFSDTLPPDWGTLSEQFGTRPLVVSFKAAPGEVVAGRHDQALLAWFRAAPRDRPTWWVYFHEPENNVEEGSFTPAEFRAAWTHVAELAQEADNPNLHATAVLMCWTVNPASGREVDDYAQPGMGIDVLAWDCYNSAARTGSYLPPPALLDRARSASERLEVDWGVAELGSKIPTGHDGTERAQWLAAVADYARDHEAAFITYFNTAHGGDFRLTDTTSAQAWAEEMAEG